MVGKGREKGSTSWAYYFQFQRSEWLLLLISEQFIDHRIFSNCFTSLRPLFHDAKISNEIDRLLIYLAEMLEAYKFQINNFHYSWLTRKQSSENKWIVTEPCTDSREKKSIGWTDKKTLHCHLFFPFFLRHMTESISGNPIARGRHMLEPIRTSAEDSNFPPFWKANWIKTAKTGGVSTVGTFFAWRSKENNLHNLGTNKRYFIPAFLCCLNLHAPKTEYQFGSWMKIWTVKSVFGVRSLNQSQWRTVCSGEFFFNISTKRCALLCEHICMLM